MRRGSGRNRLWIDQRQLQPRPPRLQHIPHRYPIHSGGFHRHLFDFVFLEPIPEPFQFLCIRPEDSLKGFRLMSMHSSPDAYRDRLLVDIQTRASAVYDSRRAASSAARQAGEGRLEKPMTFLHGPLHLAAEAHSVVPCSSTSASGPSSQSGSKHQNRLGLFSHPPLLSD